MLLGVCEFKLLFLSCACLQAGAALSDLGVALNQMRQLEEVEDRAIAEGVDVLIVLGEHWPVPYITYAVHTEILTDLSELLLKVLVP